MSKGTVDSMRSFAIAIAVGSAALSQPILAQIQICDMKYECKNFSTSEEAGRYAESVAAAGKKQSRDIEGAMPIDYRDCIVAALSDEMNPDKTQHYFVEDMDAHLQSKLRERGIRALPESAFPLKWRAIQNRSRNTPYWHFSFAFTDVAKPHEEYQAFVGFHCGTLCLSRTTYVLKVVGNACEIVSKRWEGGA